MADTTNKKALIGAALADLVAAAKAGGPRLRIGLMTAGSEHPVTEFMDGARQAMLSDNRIQVVGIGPKPAQVPGGIDWIECHEDETAIASCMEKALDSGAIDGAVALHYPFPVGVTTIGRTFTPGKGRAILIASTTGISAPQRAQAMLLNAVYGLAVARATGISDPSLGVLNLDAAPSVVRALNRMAEKGYHVRFGQSVRKDGGSLLRGNDILAGSVDVCVCDTLTGNVLAKVFSAFSTGGGYETTGWGYGPSAGDGWGKVVSIISRASGAPVIANAICYTAVAVRGQLPKKVTEELAAARAAGLDAELAALAPKAEAKSDVPPMPKAVPTDEEIHGIDVLDLENAVHVLWKEGIYAEGAMGCTGPVVKLAFVSLAKAKELLAGAGYI